MASLPTLLIPGYVVGVETKLKPIDYIMEWIEPHLINGGSSIKDKTLILYAKTASGKSTLYAPTFYYKFSDKRGILVTQPTIINARTLPEEIEPYYKKHSPPLELGVNIGYQTGLVTRKAKGINFVTIGVLLQQLTTLEDDEIISRYSTIMIDEAHIRSIETDTTLYLMKKFLERNCVKSDCPMVVIASATFDPKKYSDYFGGANIIEVSGASHPIEDRFLKYSARDVVIAAAQMACEIHCRNPSDILDPPDVKKLMDSDLGKYVDNPEIEKYIKGGALKLDEDKPRASVIRDIIVFVHSTLDIKKIIEKIRVVADSHPFFKKYPIAVLELTGTSQRDQSQDYLNLFLPIEKIEGNPTRRIIVSTNVAETGVTIPTLKYVVDCGYRLSKEHDPISSIDNLVLKPVTKSQATQRRGRAGRKAAGQWYPLYTKEDFEQFDENIMPDMLITDISMSILKIATKTITNKIRDIYNVDLSKLPPIDIGSFDFIDKPSIDGLREAFEKLYTLGAITRDSRLTKTGILLSKISRIPIESGRMILAGLVWKYSIIDLVTVAAFIEIGWRSIVEDKELFAKSFEEGVFSKHLKLNKIDDMVIACDMTKAILVFTEFVEKTSKIEVSIKSLDKVEEWCKTVGLNFRGMITWCEQRDNISISMRQAGVVLTKYEHISVATDINNMQALKRCIYEGYKCQYATRVKDNVWRTMNTHIYFEYDAPGTRGIYTNIIKIYNRRLRKYENMVTAFTVVDGYVGYDPHF